MFCNVKHRRKHSRAKTLSDSAQFSAHTRIQSVAPGSWPFIKPRATGRLNPALHLAAPDQIPNVYPVVLSLFLLEFKSMAKFQGSAVPLAGNEQRARVGLFARSGERWFWGKDGVVGSLSCSPKQTSLPKSPPFSSSDIALERDAEAPVSFDIRA